MCGCVSVDKYPDQWGALDGGARSEICSELSGVYQNIGDTADGKHAVLALLMSEVTDRDMELPLKIRDQFLRDLSAATFVQLRVTANKELAIKVTGEEINQEWTVQKEWIECKTNAISIHRNVLAGNAAGFLAGTKSMDLYRSGDQLILNHRSLGVGVLVIVPIGGSSSHWARFTLIGKD
jgi:hypothetical protein